MNNIIFLDIDGVLNNIKFASEMWEKNHISIYNNDILYESSLKALQTIVAHTKAQLVLSSPWRHNPRAVARLEKQLAKFGLYLLDTTGGHCDCRGLEIQKWLDEHEECDNFVILDDDSDMAHLLPHLVQTDNRTGLSDEHVEEIIKHLTSTR